MSDVFLVQMEDNMKLTEMFFFSPFSSLKDMLHVIIQCPLLPVFIIQAINTTIHVNQVTCEMKANMFPLILKADKKRNVPLQSYQLMLIVSMINLFFPFNYYIPNHLVKNIKCLLSQI